MSSLNVLANSRGPEMLHRASLPSSMQEEPTPSTCSPPHPGSSDFPKEPTATGGGHQRRSTSYTAAGVHGQVKEGDRFGIIGLGALE